MSADPCKSSEKHRHNVHENKKIKINILRKISMKHSTDKVPGGTNTISRPVTCNLSKRENNGNLLSPKRPCGKSFFHFMEGTIVRLRQFNRMATAKNYAATLNSFRLFRHGNDLSVRMVDRMLVEDYQAYLVSTGITPNSSSFYMRILRAVYNRAVEQELTPNRQPFRTVFTGTEKTVKRAMTIDHIRRIIELDLHRMYTLEKARDLFVFLFLCRGMSFIDAAFLKKTDIKNGILVYRRHKTGRRLYIKVTPQMHDIIRRHSDEASPYLLAVITSPGNNERKQYETALRNTNKSLKAVAAMIRLPVALTTYVSRHAWASIAKAKNISVNVISDALGHDSIATTQIYLDSIDSAIIDNANEMIIQDLYENRK